MHPVSQAALAFAKTIARFLVAIVVAGPFAVAVGLVCYNVVPDRWLGGSDGYVVFGSLFVLPLVILAAAFDLLFGRRLFGKKPDWLVAFIVIAMMAIIDGLMVYGAGGILFLNHLAAGTRIVDVADCEPKPFFKRLDRCNGKTYGLRGISTARIEMGTPRWTMARLTEIAGTRPDGDTDCEVPEAHRPMACGRFGLPDRMQCFFCRGSGQSRKSSLLAFAPRSGKLIRIWSDEFDLSAPQSRPDRMTAFFDTAPYW